MSAPVYYSDLGLIAYKEAWDLQEKVFSSLVDRKISNRKALTEAQEPLKHFVFFCEHPHTYTLGKSGKEDHLLLNNEQLKEEGIDFYKINRGGDITYHGPGQIVVYPLLDLDDFFTDIHKYLRYLEEAVIQTIAHYGISAGRIEGLTGVWLDRDNPMKARKICAMGVKCSRWVTMHGLAFNVNADLSKFGNIVPCGISDKAVTSLHLELGRELDFNEVKSILLLKLKALFQWDLQLLDNEKIIQNI